MPLEWLVVRQDACVPVVVVVVAADELVAEHFAGHSGAELQLVAAHATELVVAVHVPAVHSDGFGAGLVVGGELS